MVDGRRIPSSQDILLEVVEALGYNQMKPQRVRASFNEMLRRLTEATFARYELYEQEVNSKNLIRRLLDDSPEALAAAEIDSASRGFRSGVQLLFSRLYPELRRAFSAVAQGRMSRGGKSFEYQFAFVAQQAGFPFDTQSRKTRTDMIMPSQDAFDFNSTICAVVSLKRTLRERWMQVVAELVSLKAPNVFLVTADERVTAGHVKGICDENGLHLVVWDEVKAKLPAHPRVLSFTQFANERLPNLQSQWAATGLS